MVFNPVFLKYSSSRKIKTIYNIVKWSWKSKSEFSPFCELCSLRSKQIQNFLWTWSILAKTILILLTHNRSHASEQSPVSDDVKQRIIFLQSSPAMSLPLDHSRHTVISKDWNLKKFCFLGLQGIHRTWPKAKWFF